ncbi:hypothetical protein KKD70_00030 [Patescibacteria group bacterium]|nr:hypothetical protein [Patescibacteria group bacterium]
MENEITEEQSVAYDAPKFSFLSLITRSIAGFGGGIAGTLVLLIIWMLSNSVLAPVMAPADEIVELDPLFIFVLMGMIFISTLVSNMVGPLLISFTQKERYQRTATALFQIFIINIIIFLITIPVYLFSSGFGIQFLSYAAGLQISFSILASALVFEIVSNFKYALVGVYGTIVAILSGIAINIMFYQATGSATVLLFVALPLLWGGVGFTSGIVTMLYNWMVSVWGNDFLATSQSFSKDYGIAEEPIEVEVDEKVEDTEGIDFLRHDGHDQ